MNIVVTGASRGIGFETVRELASDPQNQIIALSRNLEGLERLQQVCNERTNNVSICQADLCDLTSSSLEKLASTYGHIDIIINNAGSLINKRFTELSIAEWKDIFEVNLFGVVQLIKMLLPFLRKSNSGHIVNIGSMGGVQGTSKFPGLSAYSASKAALANLTECLAEELKEYSIRVNCLAVGSVNTEMLHEAFPGYNAPTNADEMAKFIAWFSLNGGRLMNGKIVPMSINTP